MEAAPARGGNELRRVIGFWDSLALVVGLIIGSGIFRAPSFCAWLRSSSDRAFHRARLRVRGEAAGANARIREGPDDDDEDDDRDQRIAKESHRPTSWLDSTAFICHRVA